MTSFWCFLSWQLCVGVNGLSSLCFLAGATSICIIMSPNSSSSTNEFLINIDSTGQCSYSGFKTLLARLPDLERL
ncbi:hypothetical protein DFH27DRAFT_539473 [Peziza echinospora]|nr:hypothetical protein DFH27DRAFT_539473 [Peziza echinospora]